MITSLIYKSLSIRQLCILWSYLSKTRRFQCLLLILFMLVSAIAEVMSIGALLPFLSTLAAPEKVFAQPFVQEIAHNFGIENADQLLKPLTIFFVIAAIIAGAVRLLLLWITTRFVFATGADLSMEIYRRTLYQPYSVHIARNSSEIISGITNKTHALIY